MNKASGPYLVIYPDGDRKRLCVVNAKCNAIKAYCGKLMASKQLFHERSDANIFAADFARQNYINAPHLALA